MTISRASSTRKMNKQQAIDFAWAAGFFEGEGHIRIRKFTKRRRMPEHQLHIVIANTHYESIQWLQEMFGGRIHTLRRGTGSLYNLCR